ncbi:UNVERIFIED_CONTAM: hypothetical protein ABIC26_001704 [Paenibacillus sp. PvR008]
MVTGGRAGILTYRNMRQPAAPLYALWHIKHSVLAFFHLQWRDRAGFTPASLLTAHRKEPKGFIPLRRPRLLDI